MKIQSRLGIMISYYTLVIVLVAFTFLRVKSIVSVMVPLYIVLIVTFIPILFELLFPKVKVIFFIKHLVSIITMLVFSTELLSVKTVKIPNLDPLFHFTLLVFFTVLFFIELVLMLKKQPDPNAYVPSEFAEK